MWGARREAVHELSDLLGDDHDLAVLRGELEARRKLADDAVRTLAAVVDRRRGELQRAALPLGARLFAQPTDAMVDQLGACWRAWREEAELSAAPRALALATAE